MIIELLDGTRLDVENYGLKRLFHYIPSAEINNEAVTIQGRGEYITDSYINQRNIRVEFGFRVNDIYDYYLLRDELNELFLRQEIFYIIFKREPHKRWKVKINNGFEIPPTTRLANFVIEFRTVNKYADSTFTLQELQNRKEWDLDLFAWNGSIDWDSDYFYQFNTNQFTVSNLGNVEIDPIKTYLKITVRGNFPSFLQITNNTNGTIYRYNKTITTSDVLVIEGTRTLFNNTSDFGGTNKKFVRLSKGNNNFTISGGTVNSVEFDFRFLYS